MSLPRTLSRALAMGTAFLGSATAALAAAVPGGVLPSGDANFVSADVDFKTILSFAATYLLSIAGGIAVLFLVIGGIIYTSAGGSDERVQKAKKYMQNAIIGLVVVVLAFVIVSNTLKITYSLNEQADMSLTPSAPSIMVIGANPTTVVITCNNATMCPALNITTPKTPTGAEMITVGAPQLGTSVPTATYSITKAPGFAPTAPAVGQMTFTDPVSNTATSITVTVSNS